LIRLAGTGLFRARWTDRILDECFSNIVAARPELEGKLDRTRQLMEKAIPDARVTEYEPIAAGLSLPDENDRHVLAAAIRSGAQVIVTANLRAMDRAAVPLRPSRRNACPLPRCIDAARPPPLRTCRSRVNLDTRPGRGVQRVARRGRAVDELDRTRVASSP